MAAGRGEFFRSLKKGLERIPARRFLEKEHQFGSVEKVTLGLCDDAVKQRMQRRKNTPGRLCQVPARQAEGEEEENLIERLPLEVLFNIVAYLDACSLFCISQVNKLFYQLGTDNHIWQKIYMTEFGLWQTWKPKLDNDVEEAPEVTSNGHWKKMYFKEITSQGLRRWKRELKDICPHMGIPVYTKEVLRNYVGWELIVSDCFGQTMTLEPSQHFFFKSSMTICWSHGPFPKYPDIRNIQLYGRKKPPLMGFRVKKSNWRSLIVTRDVSTHPRHLLGKDRLVKLMYLSPAFIIGLWGPDLVAFIMVSLHFHRLVERSLLGSPVCPYMEQTNNPLLDKSDPDYGLHGYNLHFVLHNTVTEVMVAQFDELSCHKPHSQRGLVKLTAISESTPTEQRPLSGDFILRWRSKMLEGSVEKCCWMSLTLLDEFQKPFWCVSAPTGIRRLQQKSSVNDTEETFLMHYKDEEGLVKIKLTWRKQHQQFFVVRLVIYIPVYKVNQHFGSAAVRSVGDAVNLALHFILHHLDFPVTYARIRCVDHNTILLSLLQDKLNVPDFHCRGIIDFPSTIRLSTKTVLKRQHFSNCICTM